MARTAKTPRESIWTGAPYGTTNRVGNPDQWRAAFDDALHSMGIEEAQTIVGADDPFTILGLKPSASAAEIKTAYRAAILKNHPDKNPDDPVGAGERTKRIIAAYKLLKGD